MNASSDTTLKKLSAVDEYLLRKILGAPSKTQIEALFLESGCIPIKYKLMMRRLMYLHHIQSITDNELIKRFYVAQKSKPSRGDWTETVKEDKKELNLKISDEEISKISKNTFEKLIKESVLKRAFEELIKKKETHSKMSNVQYSELKIQDYLKSDCELSNDDKEILFKFRTRMAKLKNNFKNMFKDVFCQLCQTDEECQSHLFYCDILLKNCKDLAENTEVEYEDIFNSKLKQVKAIKLLSKIWKTRNYLLDIE